MIPGVISMGVRLPIIREGDNLKQAILDSLDMDMIDDNDVIGITESIVARAQGNYVTVNDVAKETIRLFGEKAEIVIDSPIYSRNRFAMILKGVARAAKKLHIIMPYLDEVGNPSGVNPFTGVDIEEYYKDICKKEHCKVVIHTELSLIDYVMFSKFKNWLYCGLHNYESWKRNHQLSNEVRYMTLKDYFQDKCRFGLLGCNKSTEERIKLFPDTTLAQELCNDLQESIKTITGRHVIVCVYGDGCFKDPVGGIWEFADPTTMPAYTDANLIQSSPNEVKLKAIIDEGKTDSEVIETIKNKDKNLIGEMLSQGTTPRKYRDLLASLMDLTSGSGDRGTPVVLIKNYFNVNYSTK